ncbi:MAG TPA: type IV pilus assembly protein PilM [Candidatus Yonathbacteria bacterium]|nr:type IV pilus assembly protein PilM [Candidatus Yonathbacteria bacterium]
MVKKLLYKILNYKIPVFIEKTVLGIDIGASAIKVVQLRSNKGKVVLENYGELALGPYVGEGVGQAVTLSTEKISEALVDVLKEAKITSEKTAIAIPLGSSLLSFITLPTRDPTQLARMIPIEARKYIPVPISEVALDWWVLPNPGGIIKKSNKKDKDKKKEPDQSEVVIAAIHNETIDKYKQIQAMTGLTVDTFEIEIFSSIRSVVGRDMKPIIILDIGAGSSKLAMVEYGIVKSYHSINMGSQDITSSISKAFSIDMVSAEKLKREFGLDGEVEGHTIKDIAELPLGHIFSEAKNAIATFNERQSKPISKIILVGGGALLGGLQEFAQKEFEINVVLGDPFSKVETPAFLDNLLKRVGPEFAVALGVSLKALQE